MFSILFTSIFIYKLQLLSTMTINIVVVFRGDNYVRLAIYAATFRVQCYIFYGLLFVGGILGLIFEYQFSDQLFVCYNFGE